MGFIVQPHEALELGPLHVGHKTFALARMLDSGLAVPPFICITTEAYNAFLDQGALREQIAMEFGRRQYESMRWEEMWDASLRIRNLFLRTAMPLNVEKDIRAALDTWLEGPVAVRSSAPGEDSSDSSFAGVHESYINVRGPDAVLKHVRLVWASLWSDAAILYRQELEIDTSSTMAVLVQAMIAGQSSGVAFWTAPNDIQRSMVEAVHGLNQALVDGSVEPDRWVVNQENGDVLEHTEPSAREHYMIPDEHGGTLQPLPAELAAKPPLDKQGVGTVHELMHAAVDLAGAAQDVEWTRQDSRLYLLQSRPITTGTGGDERKAWYLTLRRSLDNLCALREKIEEDILPAMKREADTLGTVELNALSDSELDAEWDTRDQALAKWRSSYEESCIPMAHGMRLFGEFYNTHLLPDDPYEFARLMTDQQLEAKGRNAHLLELAERIRNSGLDLERIRREGSTALEPRLLKNLERLCKDHQAMLADLSPGDDIEAALSLILTLAQGPSDTAETAAPSSVEMRDRFLQAFHGEDWTFAKRLLDLALASYRLRDDDNTYLGRFEHLVEQCRKKALARLRQQRRVAEEKYADSELRHALRDEDYDLSPETPQTTSAPDGRFAARQIVGQPAGPGIATGQAFVIHEKNDLLRFPRGSVLVCDALNPNMTMVIPLAAAIIERRGGMLIHGAIMAREYGIPCVTGIDQATELIRDGAQVSVDGFLGIVRIGDS